MFYEGISKVDNTSIVSWLQIVTWTKLGVALDVGVGSPHLIQLDDGTSCIYYTGQSRDGSTAIGVAMCDSHNCVDLTQWTREQAQFTFQ